MKNSSLRKLHLRQLIDAIDDAVLILDLDDEQVIDANERACSLYAIAPGEIGGTALKTLPEDFVHWTPILRAKLRQSRSYRFETVRRRRDGSEISLQVHTTVLDPAEMIVLSISRDVTAERRMREELESAASEWQITFDAIEESVVVVDQHGIIKRANRSASILAGATTELTNARMETLADRKPWTHAARLVAHVLAERTPMSMQKTDPATQQTWDLSATMASGGAPHVVVAMKDISDIVTLEASARRNERVAEMGHLVGAVAHEARNPLFVISASFDALQARLGSVDEVVAVHMRNLREQIDRLAALMHDLLEFGKPPEMQISVAPLDRAVDDAIAGVAPLTSSQSIALRNEFPPELGLILMDRARLSRAIQNLLENAIHHTPAGGMVCIRGGTVHHSMRTWIWCSIEDSGAGFGAVDPSRVFEPFFSKRAGGTGLGLSIVQRTIEIHGGRISAANGEFGGARMTIEMPRMQE
jgi:PAS domain S-box-containing protein